MSPGAISREQAHFVRSLLLDAYGINAPSGDGLLLYVSRRDAKMRNVINENAFRQALEKLGFTTIAPGEMTAEEQISTFAAARLIIGPIGSNNTNVVFSPDETGLIELAPAQYCHPSIWMLAKQKDMQYGLVTTDQIDSSMNMRVDVKTVCDMAEQMLARISERHIGNS